MSQEKVTLQGTVSLTRLKHVLMEKKGKSGMIKGIFIPIDANALEINKYVAQGKEVEEINIPVRVLYNPVQDAKTTQNGFIAKGVSKDFYNANKDNESLIKELSPILGNIKDWSSSERTPINNDAGGGETYTEEDDLPF